MQNLLKNKVFGCDILNSKSLEVATELNENDRKILDKYTKFYTNFIESNTAGTGIHEDERLHRNE